MIAFISNIFNILDILLNGVAEIMLRDDFIIKKNIKLFKFTWNLYNFSLSFSVFCHFCEIIGYSVAFIYIKSNFNLNLFYLFYLYNAFCVDISVFNSNINLLVFSVYNLF